MDAVDPDAVEAARGMGMSPLQIVTRVELPLALPLIFAGVRTAAVYVVATATIAAIAGGGGLGEIIVNQASYRLAGVVGAALCVSALAFAVDFAFAGPAAARHACRPARDSGLARAGHEHRPQPGRRCRVASVRVHPPPPRRTL